MRFTSRSSKLQTKDIIGSCLSMDGNSTTLNGLLRAVLISSGSFRIQDYQALNINLGDVRLHKVYISYSLLRESP